VAEAREAGALTIEAHQLTLTAAGRSLGEAMEERIAAASTQAIEAFRPYIEYVPERWWP